MQSQNSAYSNPRFADFTSAMMRSSVPAGTAPQKRDDTTRSRQHQGEAATFRNRNLSSILSRIADDGPADMKPAPQKVDRVPGIHGPRGTARCSHSAGYRGCGCGRPTVPPRSLRRRGFDRRLVPCPHERA